MLPHQCVSLYSQSLAKSLFWISVLSWLVHGFLIMKKALKSLAALLLLVNVSLLQACQKRILGMCKDNRNFYFARFQAQ